MRIQNIDAHLIMKKIPLSAMDPAPLTAETLADHVSWAYRFVYSQDFVKQAPSAYLINRIKHGIMHATRVAIYTQVFNELYGQFTSQKLSPAELDKIMLTAVFHDIGRESDGVDLWDKDSAELLYFYAVYVRGYTPESIIPYVEYLANKDCGPDHPYYKWSGYDEKTSPKWSEEKFEPSQRTLALKILHDADSLDICRVKPFKVEYLYFYQEVALKDRAAFEKLAVVLRQAHSLLVHQGDSIEVRYIDIKRAYENENCLQATQDLIKKLGYFGVTTDAKEEEKSNHTTEEQKVEELYKRSLLNGELFVRGVAVPSAIHTKLTPSGQYETMAALEIRKTLRRPGVATRTLKPNNLTKNGNPNRSVSLIGWGADFYSSAGFGMFKDKLTFRKISARNLVTGTGKRNHLNYPVLSEQEATLELNKLRDNLKMANHLTISSKNLHFKHNEIVADITDFDFICYVTHSVYFNKTKLVNPTFISKPAAFLQAYFLQVEYQKATNKRLPIFKYNPDHNELSLHSESSLTSEFIVGQWQKLLEELRAHAKKNKKVRDFIENAILANHKTYAMYYQLGSTNSAIMRLAPADSNYPQGSQDMINRLILYYEYEKFKEISACYKLTYLDGSLLELILVSQESQMSKDVKNCISKNFLSYIQENDMHYTEESDYVLFNALGNYLRHRPNIDFLDKSFVKFNFIGMYLIAQKFEMKEVKSVIQKKAAIRVKTLLDQLNIDSADFFKDLKEITYFVCYFDVREDYKIQSILQNKVYACFLKFLKSKDAIKNLLFYINYLIEFEMVTSNFAMYLVIVTAMLMDAKTETSIQSVHKHYIEKVNLIHPIQNLHLPATLSLFYQLKLEVINRNVLLITSP